MQTAEEEGYQEQASQTLIFQQNFTQITTSTDYLAAVKPFARKCSLPVRAPYPGTDILPDDATPKEVSEGAVVDISASVGFLSDLELQVQRKGMDSALAKACIMISYAINARKLHRPSFTTKAEVLYHELLRPSAQIRMEAERVLADLELIESHAHAIRQGASILNNRLAQWEDSVAPESRPITISHVLSGSDPYIEVGHWPGPLHMYTDLRAAAIFNISRVARCYLLDIIFRLKRMQAEAEHDDQERVKTVQLLQDFTSSIPYHLFEDLHAFSANVQRGNTIEQSGRAVGGLLLMYPLYIASRLCIVPKKLQEYFKRCLVWIGQNMGVGYASLLAKTSFHYLTHVKNFWATLVNHDRTQMARIDLHTVDSLQLYAPRASKVDRKAVKGKSSGATCFPTTIDPNIAKAALLKARKPDHYCYASETFETLIERIAGCFAHAIPTEAPQAALIIGRAIKLNERCGAPQEHTLLIYVLGDVGPSSYCAEDIAHLVWLIIKSSRSGGTLECTYSSFK
ncbi:hypothetical protein BBP40_000561 [Aspergillus hancockii]|nr:hypothetical protein BBP40_000561 [Aspergillus hancockii]